MSIYLDRAKSIASEDWVEAALNPQRFARALKELVAHCERIESEWIDPQRIVELAKRYTDEDRVGYVELAFYDHDDREPQWQIIRSGGAHDDARTANEALSIAEAS